MTTAVQVARQAASAGLLGGLALALLSCFEPPIDERLLLRLLPGGGAELELAVRLADDRPAAHQRVDALRAELEAGVDAWSRRFARLEPERERTTLSREHGTLVAVERHAVAASEREVAAFFADTALDVRWSASADGGELRIVPATPIVDRADRQRMARAERRWSADLAAYYTALAVFYAELEPRPELAPAAFRALFDESEEDDPPLPGALGAAVASASAAIERVLEAFHAAAGESESLVELSRRVHDPSPARLFVELPGPALESEGFARSADGRLEVPRRALDAALRSLAGRWASPDPIAEALAATTAGDDAPDLTARLAAAPRRGQPVTAAAVLEAVRRELAGPALLRATWGPVSEPDSARSLERESADAR